MKIVMYRLLGCVALLVCSIPTLGNAQQPQVLSLDRPIDLHIHKGTMMLVINMLSLEKNIPIGVEFSANEKSEPKLDINVKQAPLVEVLNLIVQQEPAYVWELRDGVINFTPVQNRDPLFEKLLNTSVRSFVSPRSDDRFVIRDALLNVPEINELIRTNGLEVETLGYPHKRSFAKNDVDLSDMSTKFRSLLNKIIREGKHKTWLLKWSDKKQKIFELSF